MSTTDHDRLRFHEAIRFYRKRAALTQHQAAARAGISIGGLRDLEQGRVSAPRAITLRRLAEAFDLTPNEADALLRSAARTTPGFQIRVLGALSIVTDGAVIGLGSEVQRMLLGVLALSANRPVHRDVLIDAVWGDSLPRGAPSLLQTHISRLRRRFDHGPELLTARHGGYQLTVTETQLDLLAFASLLARARQARSNSDLTTSCELYREANKLWRGRPLDGLSTLHDWPAVVALTQDKHTATIEYADVAAELGLHDEVIGALQQLIDVDPLNESAHARLMVALAGSGQQTAALNVFERLRHKLGEELGVDPGPAVTAAHQRVLRQEIRASGSNQMARANAYRLLPTDIADFTGRQLDLAALHKQIPSADEPGPAVVISVIEGMAGVGKTRLAVRFAHELVGQGRYSELQLYVDLRGYSDEPAADPAAVLESFLILLGIPGSQIPPDLDSRAALFRDRLHDKNALILLDNAADEMQVAPLLPVGNSNLVLITSRRTLALDGARSHALDALTKGDALALLARIAGPDRVSADEISARRVVEFCAHLPLAIALAGRRLRSRATWTLADLAERLSDIATRVVELVAGSREIGAVFDLSYAALDANTQRLFRLLGVHPGDELTVESAAALTGATPQETRRILDRLVDERLITEITAKRFRLHDLLRAYALSKANLDAVEAAEARKRVLWWYLYAADQARLTALPKVGALPEAELDDQARPPHLPTFADDKAAQRWLADEKATLIAVGIAARENGLFEIAWRLPLVCAAYFELVSAWQAWIDACETGLCAARESNNPVAEAACYRSLSVAHNYLRQLDHSIAYAQRALELSRAVEDPSGEAYALRCLGDAYMENGDLNDAVTHLKLALDLADRVDNTYFHDIALNNLGCAYLMLHQYDDAIGLMEQVLDHRRALNDPHGVAALLHNLGETYVSAGRFATAVAYLEEANEINHATRTPWFQAETLEMLGVALLGINQPERARECWTRALMIMDRLGHPLAARVRDRLDELDRPASVAGSG